MTIQAVALLISIGTAVFTAGLFFGNLRGRLNRTREHLRDHGTRVRELESVVRRMSVRMRDLERSHGILARRPYVTRYIEDQDPTPPELPPGSSEKKP